MADQGSEGLLSPYLRKKRIKAVTPWLKGRILDVGCGTGMLAHLVGAEEYLGVERDEISLQTAKTKFPKHKFISELPEISEKFNTVVLMAVIEHIAQPAQFLSSLAKYLENTELSHIVMTTPHPSVDWLHGLGSQIGLFSKHANEEHEDLLDYFQLETIGIQADLKLQSYSRFLFGVNQIAVYSKIFL